MPEGMERFGTKSDMERAGIPHEENDARVFVGYLLKEFPSAVCATIVDDNDSVAPSKCVLYGVENDIGLVFHNEKAEDFHIRSRC